VAGDGRDLILLADTFNRYFEPANLDAAARMLRAAGYRLHRAPVSGRPLCCGRTFLAAGLVDEARAEARRTIAALGPLVAQGARVVGLEPSCLLTFRDEMQALGLGAGAAQLGRASFLFEEVLAADLEAGRITLPLADQGGLVAHVHGHCHQKALGAFAPVPAILSRIPGLEVRVIESACCGMAGAFGHQAESLNASRAMGELALLPAVRAAGDDDLIVADGTSCRKQINDGTGRHALHVAVILDGALLR